jgi:Tfp pilus assembly protein PilO
VTARDRIVVLVLAAVAAAAGFWFFVVSPKREAIAAADMEVVTQQQRLDQAQQLLATAQGAKRRYTDDYAAVARLGKAVPADDNMASLVYDLQNVARGAKVTFKSIKLGGSAGTPAAATGSPPNGASAAPATQTAASQLPPGATVGTAGLATMPFSFIFEGSFLDMQRFVERVNGFVHVRGDDVRVRGRLLTVDGISFTTAEVSSRVKATIAATAYLAPDSAAGGSTAASGTPSPNGAAPSTTTPATPSATASGSNSTTAITAAPTR